MSYDNLGLFQSNTIFLECDNLFGEFAILLLLIKPYIKSNCLISINV